VLIRQAHVYSFVKYVRAIELIKWSIEKIRLVTSDDDW